MHCGRGNTLKQMQLQIVVHLQSKTLAEPYFRFYNTPGLALLKHLQHLQRVGVENLTSVGQLTTHCFVEVKKAEEFY